MKTDEAVSKMEAAAEKFAADRIAPAQLYKAEEFPMEIWKAMGEAGILGIGVPQEFGGQGGGYTDIARCGRILGAAGHSLGLTVSWMLHLAAARFLIMNMGTREQKEDLLPKLARGDITMSLSISEPKTGAHPKHMKTRAVLQDGSYMISGEKAYLTNGPIAGMYAVIAITDEKEEKKQFTAFLVPRETPGLTVGENMALDFFKPSPHGGIVLEACKVPESAVLGPFNQGYEAIVKAFRDTEDILMMGPVCGGMDRIGVLLAEQLKKAGKPSDEKLEALGLYLSLCKGLFALALHGAEKLDRGTPDPDLAMIPVAFRFMSKKALEVAQTILEDVKPEEGSELAVTLNDLIFSGRIAGNVSKIKQKMMGKAALI
ncbi:acyl-CoA dehydrogenase [Desulfatibacillum alkenivorans DSM 16219]|uniref:Acyl-CoA dehydrogenase n=1 Tax=Desulfatibacillum alkenivorans DSM 16219 TaxID=1121393 RepID=A0A1M6NZC7_9BACT|nr:acyl-CoA dehydrogenase family protein [Desulfatibacillum alkenivorans]SHK01046.1 acyl-CoA dehydrogenase [Desulfatibacillum alkenivorans DSM 16219]